MKIFYITTCKNGMHAFTFRELELLEENGVTFTIGFTELANGPFMPKSKWDYSVLSAGKLIQGLYATLVRIGPLGFLKIVLESVRLKKLKYLLSAISFLGHSSTRNTSHIHCQMANKKLFIAYFTAKILKVKYSTTLHAHELYRVYNEDGRNLKHVYEHANKIFTISQFNVEEILEKYPIPASKVKLMYLYPANFTNSISSKMKFLIVANWFKKKGYDFLIQAIIELKKKRSDFILWIVGSYNGDINSIDVNKLLENSGLNDCVTVFGPQPKNVVDVLMYACDAFCLPSVTIRNDSGVVIDREGIPVALMEAMMWGKPVISTNHAGIPELVPKQFLVEEHNVSELVEAFERLLDKKESLQDIGSQNEIIVRSKFNEENIGSLVSYFNETTRSA